jgi:hypothetical protein
VKHGVDIPLCGKFQAIVDSGHHLNDLKRCYGRVVLFGFLS